MKKNICLVVLFIVLTMFFSCSKADNSPFVPDDSFQISLTVIKAPNPFIFQLIADVRYTCQSNVTMRVVVDWGDGKSGFATPFVLPAANNGVSASDIGVHIYDIIKGTRSYLVRATFTPEGSTSSSIELTTNITTVW